MWQSAAFTIHSVVWSCLDAGKKSIVDPATMSVRQNECLSTLVRFCGVVGSNFGEPKVRNICHASVKPNKYLSANLTIIDRFFVMKYR